MMSAGTGKRNSALVIDFGLRRIGIAKANLAAETSQALTTLNARDGIPEWEKLAQLIDEWQPDLLVVGLPLNEDGSSSDMTREVRRFANILPERYGLEVELVDERQTSIEAREHLVHQRRAGIRTKKLKRKDVDSFAAQIIADRWISLRRAEGD